jgi:hypothetical protein
MDLGPSRVIAHYDCHLPLWALPRVDRLTAPIGDEAKLDGLRGRRTAEDVLREEVALRAVESITALVRK